MKLHTLLALAAVTVAPSLAMADDSSRAYVDLGGTLGVEHVGYFGATVGGGLRLGQTPLFARAELGTGAASQLFSVDGSYRSLRAGLEARECRRSMCVSLGADLGVRDVHLVYTSDTGMQSVDEDGSYGLAVPRVGAQLGHHLKLQVAIEVPIAMRREETLVGFGVAFGAGYAF